VRHAGPLRHAVTASGSALLAVTVLALAEGGDVESLTAVCVLGTAVALLCAGVFFYLYWHVGDDRSVAWLVTVVSAAALQKLNWFMLLNAGPPTDGADAPWCLVFQMVVNLALVSVLVHGRRLRVRHDPLALGMLLGLAIVLMRIAVLQIPVPDLPAAADAVTLSGLVVVGLWNALRLVRSDVLTPGLRRHIATVALFFAIGQATVVDGAPAIVLLVGAVANAAGSVLLVSVAGSRARRAVVDESAALRVLRRQLDTAEQDLHSDQARLHEIRATLAGIATATELLQRSGLSGPRREQLFDMTCSELRRLDRLVDGQGTSAPAPTELDAALRPVVLRHQVDGLRISWLPTGHVAVARADDVAEIVNVLLSNVQRHAPGARVRVDTGLVGDRVCVSVADTGPGVAAEVLPALFAWGARGRTSAGQGVGLATARLLATEMGGDLELDTRAPGTRFVLSLPAISCAAPQGVRS
jgi:signal transduction histidine kinase